MDRCSAWRPVFIGMAIVVCMSLVLIGEGHAMHARATLTMWLTSKAAQSIDLSFARWENERQAKACAITGQTVQITTKPFTDLWSRTYYGFRPNNVPALLFESENNFSFTTKVSFDYRARFDQCGVIIYLDRNNWFKASVEYENETISRLGSVVTNRGHSDWATNDIPTPTAMWYRLSRRGPDFLVESSLNGDTFTQMRVFHLHRLGKTTEEMGKLDPPAPAQRAIRFGVYACSPSDASFEATFEYLTIEDCLWKAHGADTGDAMPVASPRDDRAMTVITSA